MPLPDFRPTVTDSAGPSGWGGADIGLFDFPDLLQFAQEESCFNATEQNVGTVIAGEYDGRILRVTRSYWAANGDQAPDIVDHAIDASGREVLFQDSSGVGGVGLIRNGTGYVSLSAVGGLEGNSAIVGEEAMQLVDDCNSVPGQLAWHAQLAKTTGSGTIQNWMVSETLEYAWSSGSGSRREDDDLYAREIAWLVTDVSIDDYNAAREAIRWQLPAAA